MIRKPCRTFEQRFIQSCEGKRLSLWHYCIEEQARFRCTCKALTHCRDPNLHILLNICMKQSWCFEVLLYSMEKKAVLYLLEYSLTINFQFNDKTSKKCSDNNQQLTTIRHGEKCTKIGFNNQKHGQWQWIARTVCFTQFELMNSHYLSQNTHVLVLNHYFQPIQL